MACQTGECAVSSVATDWANIICSDALTFASMHHSGEIWIWNYKICKKMCRPSLNIVLIGHSVSQPNVDPLFIGESFYLMVANQTLHDVWPSPGLLHYIYFRGLLPLTEFCQVQNSLCVQVLRSPILAALAHGSRGVGVSQTLRRGTRNGIMELSLLVIFAPGSKSP